MVNKAHLFRGNDETSLKVAERGVEGILRLWMFVYYRLSVGDSRYSISTAVDYSGSGPGKFSI